MNENARMTECLSCSHKKVNVNEYKTNKENNEGIAYSRLAYRPTFSRI